MCAGGFFAAQPSTTSIHLGRTTGAYVYLIEIVIRNEAHAALPQAIHRLRVLLHCPIQYLEFFTTSHVDPLEPLHASLIRNRLRLTAPA